MDEFDIVATERLDYKLMLKEMQEENETRLALLALKRMTRKRKPKQAAEPGQRKPQPRRQPKAAASKRDKPVDNDGGSSRSRESSVESQAEDQAVEAAAGQGSAPSCSATGVGWASSCEAEPQAWSCVGYQPGVPDSAYPCSRKQRANDLGRYLRAPS